jgi:DNA-binding PadR family transcriptional regulator
MRVMRVRSVKLEKLMISVLSERQPLRAKDLFREISSRLKKEEKVSEPTFYRYLEDLSKRGLIERTEKGWRLNEKGLLKQERINYLNEFLRECKIVDSGYADIYGNFEDYYLETKLSQIAFDIAREAVCRFYLQATIVFMRSHFDVDREVGLFEFFTKFTRSIGLAVWMGYRLSVEKVEANNLWELVNKVMKNEVAFERLSTFFYYGLRKIFTKDTEALTFMKILCHANFPGNLVMLLVSQDMEKVKQIYSSINEYPSEDEIEEVSRILESFLEWLKRLEATIVIPISPKFFNSISGRVAVNEFEKWLTALRDGLLDHRSWIFNQGKQKLETLIVQLKRLEPKELKTIPIESLEEAHPKIGEILEEPLDLQEPWTLGDLFVHHPRGRDIRFYQEILEEISRRENIRGVNASKQY